MGKYGYPKYFNINPKPPCHLDRRERTLQTRHYRRALALHSLRKFFSLVPRFEMTFFNWHMGIYGYLSKNVFTRVPYSLLFKTNYTMYEILVGLAKKTNYILPYIIYFQHKITRQNLK